MILNDKNKWLGGWQKVPSSIIIATILLANSINNNATSQKNANTIIITNCYYELLKENVLQISQFNNGTQYYIKLDIHIHIYSSELNYILVTSNHVSLNTAIYQYH